jgi:hypothetical protein
MRGIALFRSGLKPLHPSPVPLARNQAETPADFHLLLSRFVRHDAYGEWETTNKENRKPCAAIAHRVSENRQRRPQSRIAYQKIVESKKNFILHLVFAFSKAMHKT